MSLIIFERKSGLATTRTAALLASPRLAWVMARWSETLLLYLPGISLFSSALQKSVVFFFGTVRTRNVMSNTPDRHTVIELVAQLSHYICPHANDLRAVSLTIQTGFLSIHTEAEHKAALISKA